jgi:putative hemolysin
VCEDTIDNVIGVLSVKDYFRYRDQGREVIMKEAVKSAYFVPQGIHADVLFRQMRETRNHFAVVLDEYGGMMGIATMYDILEQLVGDLNDGDEEEVKEPDIQQNTDGTWSIKGVAQLSEVAEELKMELPTDKYDTMGGYVFSNYGMIPEDGTEFELELDRLHVRVTEIKDHRIIKMIVTVTEPEENEDDEERRFFKSRSDKDDDEEDDARDEKKEEKKEKKDKSDKEKSDRSEKKTSKTR